MARLSRLHHHLLHPASVLCTLRHNYSLIGFPHILITWSLCLIYSVPFSLFHQHVVSGLQSLMKPFTLSHAAQSSVFSPAALTSFFFTHRLSLTVRWSLAYFHSLSLTIIFSYRVPEPVG